MGVGGLYAYRPMSKISDGTKERALDKSQNQNSSARTPSHAYGNAEGYSS